MKKVLAWHFLPLDRMTWYEPRIQVTVGKKLVMPDHKITLCERGFHASVRPIDALVYAPGPVICRVELSGTIIEGEDKLVATERKAIAMADATELLFEFSMDVAARTMERAGWNDERSWNALDIRCAHMMGLADDFDLSAAGSASESAAWSATRSAAGSASESAAWSAAGSTAGSAAGSAAWSAAGSTAGSTAGSAAGSAEKDVQNEELERRIKRLLKIK